MGLPKRYDQDDTDVHRAEGFGGAETEAYSVRFEGFPVDAMQMQAAKMHPRVQVKYRT